MGESIWSRTLRSDKQIQAVVAVVTSVGRQVQEPRELSLSSASPPDPCIVRIAQKEEGHVCAMALLPYSNNPTKRTCKAIVPDLTATMLVRLSRIL
jgi:hypothetical protein